MVQVGAGVGVLAYVQLQVTSVAWPETTAEGAVEKDAICGATASSTVVILNGVGAAAGPILVTALDPIVKGVGGTWIGWSGSHDEIPESVGVEGAESEYSLRALSLTPEEVEDFYLGYSNKSLWPLFHYFQEYCEFNHEQWKSYEEINRRFADAIIYEYRPGDLIWVHDYHLMLVPALLRQALPEAKIGFFLHIPFPSDEIFQLDLNAELVVLSACGTGLGKLQRAEGMVGFPRSLLYAGDSEPLREALELIYELKRLARSDD